MSKDILCPRCQGQKRIKQTMMVNGHQVELPCSCPFCQGWGRLSEKEYKAKLKAEKKARMEANRL